MGTIWFASDHHIGHANILKFKRSDGTPLRQFNSIEEHDGYLLERHNEVVKPNDKVYFLGDAAINKSHLIKFLAFRGKKRLVRGNHDPFEDKAYYEAGFQALVGFRKFDKFACTHIPVHSDHLGRWGVNVHGHTHSNFVRQAKGFDQRTKEVLYSDKPDLRFLCVCMEHLPDYRPLALEEINDEITNRFGSSFRV